MNTRNKGKNNHTDTSVFRERLRIRCKQLGYTRQQLADKAGISVSIIDKWLNGKRNDITGEKQFVPPSFDKLKRVADALGVSIDWLTDADMTCLTVNNQMISDYTGLSDTAINNLHYDKVKSVSDNVSRQHWIDTINFLLSDCDGQKIITTIYSYLFGNYTKTTDGSSTIDVLDETGIPANGGTMDLHNLNAVFLASLVQDLSQLKANLDTIENSKYYGKYNPDTATNEAQKILSEIPPFVV